MGSLSYLDQAPQSHRRALRRAVEIPCGIVSRYVDEPLLYWATDLSPFGLWLEAPAPMQVGEQVVVCFEPMVWWGRRELTIFAEVSRVAWDRERGTRGMGLEFLDITPHEQRALSAWLRGRPPQLPKRRARKRSRRSLPAPRRAA
ncbi:MAG: PilZ domain-containing protein [Polyangiaceae bacterium]